MVFLFQNMSSMSWFPETRQCDETWSTAIKIYTRGRRKERSDDYSRKIIELNPRRARRCSIISFTVFTSLAGRCLGSFCRDFSPRSFTFGLIVLLSRWWYNKLEIRSARFRPAAFFSHSILRTLEANCSRFCLVRPRFRRTNATGNFLLDILQSESLILTGITG